MKNLMIMVLLLLIGGIGCSGGEKDATTTSSAETLRESVTAKVAEVRSTTDADQHLDACRVATKQLGGALKSALQEAMREQGPLGAVHVCYDEAQFIADQICAEQGLTVGRTSHKVRNRANAPDAWEKAGLEAFATRIAAGEKPKDLEMWATVADPDGSRTFRYLKAIPTAPMCLKCHGGELATDLAAKLTELYPADQAKGFAMGEMRGAFTVKMDLPGTAVRGG